jgi:excinuclease UvrABC helicase subunit UvrB
MKAERWTAEEVSRAIEMRDLGMTADKIGVALGRSTKSIKNKFIVLSQTPEQRIKRNEYERERRRDRDKTFSRKAGIVFEAHKARIPDAVIAERDARYSASHRDLTAAFFGDPLPGRSALDRKQGEANG